MSLELTVERGGVAATDNGKGGGQWHDLVCVFKNKVVEKNFTHPIFDFVHLRV